MQRREFLRTAGASAAAGLFVSQSFAVGAEKPAVPPDLGPWIDDTPSEVAGVRHIVIRSAAMDRDVGVNAYFPPEYETDDARYPVVYFLPGGDSTEAGGDYIFRPVDRMIRAGEIKPMIVVRPYGGKQSLYKDWPQRNVKPETWIIKELIPYIDEHFRTIAERSGRAVAGFSMGGIGSLEFATSYPELFSACCSASGPSYELLYEFLTAHPEYLGPKLEMWKKAGLTAPADGGLRGRASNFRDKVAFRLTVGGSDESKLEYWLYICILRTSALLRELGVSHEFAVLEGLGHDFAAQFTERYFKEGGGGMFRFLNRHLRAAS